MLRLYRSADSLVLSTRGEGWGLPILEAMACGLPVIATNWSAHTDFFNETNGYPIEAGAIVAGQVRRCPYYKGFNWAEPSLEHLRALLRHVYEHPEEARRKGERASMEVLSKWTWQQSARCIVDRLERIGYSGRRRSNASKPFVSTEAA